MKKIIKIYASYGKFDGEELKQEGWFEDTVEERQDILDNISYDDLLEGDIEDFIAGTCNELIYSSYGGDWDDPTGGRILVLTQEEDNQNKIEKINKEIEELKNSSGDDNLISDGYHTFGDLYEYRKIYNALLFNAWAKSGEFKVSKAKKHHDGEHCFGKENKWFIVVAELPTGQISNHYKMTDWDMFQVPEYEISPVEYDGHSPHDCLDRMKEVLKNK